MYFDAIEQKVATEEAEVSEYLSPEEAEDVHNFIKGRPLAPLKAVKLPPVPPRNSMARLGSPAATDESSGDEVSGEVSEVDQELMDLKAAAAEALKMYQMALKEQAARNKYEAAMRLKAQEEARKQAEEAAQAEAAKAAEDARRLEAARLAEEARLAA